MLHPGWFAHLKHSLHRWLKPNRALPADTDQAAATDRPSPKRSAASATADDIPVLKPTWLMRLKSKLRRPAKIEQAEVVEDTPRSSLKQTKTTVASSQVEPATDEDAAQVSRIQRVRAVLSNKWVWVPGISITLIAIIATMMWMLLQSGQEKKQLQIELVAAQKKLKQASATKPVSVSQVTVKHDAPKQAAHVATATDGTPAGTQSGDGAGGCDVSSKANVADNLKNCIESFNATTN